MATSISKVDELTVEDRKIVVSALTLALASAKRAERSAKSSAVADAYAAEAAKLESLLVRFR